MVYLFSLRNKFSIINLNEIFNISLLDEITFGRLAQLVEQLTLNQRVIGSNPISPTT